MAFQGCLYAYIVCGIDLLRAWYGPLPVSLCGIAYWIRNMIFMEATFLLTIQIGLRYLFICRWKHMKVMKDDLIVSLVLICTFGATIWLMVVKSLSPGKPKIMMVCKAKNFLETNFRDEPHVKYGPALEPWKSRFNVRSINSKVGF